MNIKEYLSQRKAISTRYLVLEELKRPKSDYIIFNRWITGKTQKEPSFLLELQELLTKKYL